MTADAATRRDRLAPPKTLPRECSTRASERRQQILEVAAELFLAHGYEAVSVDEIVRQAGGSKTNVYSQFGGKKELLIAAVEFLSTHVVAPLLAVDCSGLNLEEGLRRIARAFLTEVILRERTRALYRLVIGESARCPEIGRVWFARGPETTNRTFETFLASHAKEGRVGSLTPREAAIMFHDLLTFDFLQRVMLGIENPPSPAQIDQLADRAVNVFLYGCLGTPPATPS